MKTMNDKKSQDVYNILITPIQTTRYSKNKVSINKAGSVIETTQTYYPYKEWNGQEVDIRIDSDMSDFAVGFYEILYEELINTNILDKNDRIIDKVFAGDTMNTGIISKHRRKTKLPEHQRHCLANFWILPMWIGRDWDKNPHPEHSKTRNNCNDYIKLYLKYVKDNWDVLQKDKNVGKYFLKFKNFDDFMDKHFIPNNVESETEQDQINFIKDRAKAISESKYAKELWNYFSENELLGYKETFLEPDEYPLNKEKHPYAYECSRCNRIIANDENYSIPPVCAECSRRENLKNSLIKNKYAD